MRYIWGLFAGMTYFVVVTYFWFDNYTPTEYDNITDALKTFGRFVGTTVVPGMVIAMLISQPR